MFPLHTSGSYFFRAVFPWLVGVSPPVKFSSCRDGPCLIQFSLTSLCRSEGHGVWYQGSPPSCTLVFSCLLVGVRFLLSFSRVSGDLSNSHPISLSLKLLPSHNFWMLDTKTQLSPFPSTTLPAQLTPSKSWTTTICPGLSVLHRLPVSDGTDICQPGVKWSPSKIPSPAFLGPF